VAEAIAEVLRRCGSDLSREAIMQQAVNLREMKSAVLLPGITLNTTPTQTDPVSQLQLVRFNGKSWSRFGELLSTR
jgi:branched-chain amino acid transport system substrate-binding protein